MNKSNSRSTRDAELKILPQGSGKGNYKSCAFIKEAIINRIQEKYKYGMDIAKSLKNMEMINIISDKPIVMISKAD